MFCGSYRPSDVEILLKPIEIDLMADLELKEALIQSGKRHYSEMLSPEQLPSERYLTLFHQAHEHNRAQLSADCLRLAQLLIEKHGPELTLVSLARAGTPIGAILRHLIARISGSWPGHYSVSIIRDRGIDTAALGEILARGHRPESIAFIDGWTGKGVISRELSKAIRQYNVSHGTSIDAGLNVLTESRGLGRAGSLERGLPDFVEHPQFDNQWVGEPLDPQRGDLAWGVSRLRGVPSVCGARPVSVVRRRRGGRRYCVP